MGSRTNLPSYFPKLRYEVLRSQAKRWIEKFEGIPITAIHLYPYVSSYQADLKRYVPTRYVVVIEVASTCEDDKFKRLVAATDYYQTLPSERLFLEFVTADFTDVYKEISRDDFRTEWVFIAMRQGDSLPIGVRISPNWRLWIEQRSRRHRFNCRRVASQLWNQDPDRTIVSIIESDEILQACEENEYSPKALRDWIKDLCPNRSPGRRAKK